MQTALNLLGNTDVADKSWKLVTDTVLGRFRKAQREMEYNGGESCGINFYDCSETVSCVRPKRFQVMTAVILLLLVCLVAVGH